MTSLLKSKKAQAPRNVLIVIISLFIVGFLLILLSYVGISILNEYAASSYFADADSQKLINQFKAVYNIFDYIVLFLLLAFTLGIAYTSFKIRTHPAFMVVTIIAAPFYGLVSYFFNAIFVEIVSQPVLSATLTLFPITYIICTNLHWVALAIIVIGAIALYAKLGDEPGFQEEPLT